MRMGRDHHPGGVKRRDDDFVDRRPSSIFPSRPPCLSRLPPTAKTWIRTPPIKHPCHCKPTHLGRIPQLDPIGNRLSGETNIESIRDLEEQIREHERVTIELKRTRNSLLNVSRLPPEVLGNIFQWNVSLKTNFGGLERRSRNFLFVCHHWFEVALRTPEVWSFWGNIPEDWARWHRQSGTAPLDLVLNSIAYDRDTFNVTLRDTLQDRAARDAIRRIHLRSGNAAFLSSILSPLTVACEGVRSNSVESFILINDDSTSVDTSDFFAHHRFPKLQRLELKNSRIESWDLLASQTTVLTTLILHLGYSSSIPTTSQLLTILASNPTLQKISLSRSAVPNDGGDGGGKSPSRVPLHNLKELQLDGGLPHVIGLLHRLHHPTNMDKLDITIFDCAIVDISQTIGPYLRDYLRRRSRSKSGLGLSVSKSERHITLCAGDTGAIDPSPPVWAEVATFVDITMELDQIPQDLLETGVLDLIAHTPREEIVLFRSWGDPVAIQDVSAQLPNLRTLHFGAMPLPPVFQEPSLGGNEKLLPSLQHIFVERVYVDDDGWSPIATFLAHRASSGNPLVSLTIVDSPHMCLPEKERIKGLVQEFWFDRLYQGCPFRRGVCLNQHS